MENSQGIWGLWFSIRPEEEKTAKLRALVILMDDYWIVKMNVTAWKYEPGLLPCLWRPINPHQPWTYPPSTPVSWWISFDFAFTTHIWHQNFADSIQQFHCFRRLSYPSLRQFHDLTFGYSIILLLVVSLFGFWHFHDLTSGHSNLRLGRNSVVQCECEPKRRVGETRYKNFASTGNSGICNVQEWTNQLRLVTSIQGADVKQDTQKKNVGMRFYPMCACFC